MSQTKIVEKIVRFELFLTVNYVKVTYRKTFQNKIFPELNSKKHTPTNRLIFTKLRNCAKLSQTRNRAILREMTFANYCANCCFFAQNWCAKKEKFCVSFRKNYAKVLRMETLIRVQTPDFITILCLKFLAGCGIFYLVLLGLLIRKLWNRTIWVSARTKFIVHRNQSFELL